MGNTHFAVMTIQLLKQLFLVAFLTLGRSSFIYLSAQCANPQPLLVQNPSFEGTPQPHITPTPWTNCQPSQTPDTQPGSWGVTLPPTNGSTYLGLVHDPASNWQEGASQLLSSPMLSGTQYSFTIDLANSSSTGGGISPGCAECQIWGGNGTCGFGELLWASGNITPFDVWQTYTVTFTPSQNWPYLTIYINSLGCSSQPYILVDNMSPILPSSVTVSTVVDNHVRCNGGNDGQATAHAVGKNPPFTYVWSTTPSQTDTVLNNVAAGTYTVTVTDANTCTSTATAVITEPQAITLTPTLTDATCFGTATGSAYMSYAGGTAPMNFAWSNGPATQKDTALFAGVYTLTVSDANSCSATTSVTINEPDSITIAGTVTNVTCIGESNGSIATTVSGGTTPYAFYQWSTTPAQNTALADSLAMGNYTITVTDQNACTATAVFTVAQPPNGLSVTITPTHVFCYGDSTGGVTTTTTGGSPPYQYLWNTSPAQTSPNLSHLTAGSYAVTVSDSNGCSWNDSVDVHQPPSPVSATLTVTDVLCYGKATGSIAVSATGGIPSYTYSWSTTPTQTTAAVNNLPAGSYTVIVSDSLNCTFAATDTIHQPTTPTGITETHTDVLCYGDATGSASATATGGMPPYSYLWNTLPAQSSPTISSLNSGNYMVSATDANGCTDTLSVYIAQPSAPLSATAAITQVNCYGAANGAIAITAAGGTPTYSYQWSAPISSVGASSANLAPGSYSVTLSDANNCTFALSSLIVTEPSALAISPIVTDVSCPAHGDGSIATHPSGGVSPYSFGWSNLTTGENNTNLDGGSYSVTVTDANGCTLTDNFQVAELPGVSLSGTAHNTLCYPLKNGSVNLSATSSFLPLQFAWSNGESTQNIAALDTGSYTVTVTDAHGCTKEAAFYIGNDSIFRINATPDTATIDLGNPVSLEVTPIGSSFGSVVWEPASVTDCSTCFSTEASLLQSATIYVTGTDVNGCIASDKVLITVIPKYEIFIPNAFTPNGDGANDYFEVFGNKSAWKQFHVDIFNRLGELVFQSDNMNFKWDGRYKGVLQNPAVFVYQLRVVYIDNYSEKLFKGSITLLR